MNRKEFLDLPELSAEQCEILDRAAQLLAELDGALSACEHKATLRIGDLSVIVQRCEDGTFRPAQALHIMRNLAVKANAN